MKLMLCPECRDIHSLNYNFRFCSCHKSSARLRPDGNSVIYRGQAVILAIRDEDIEKMHSSESPIMYDLIKMKETYSTMYPTMSLTEIQLMGHRPVDHPLSGSKKSK